MRSRPIRQWLMASAGVAALSAAPAAAQQNTACMQKLDRTEQQLQQAEVDKQRRADVDQVIEGARTLAETGDEEGCMRVVAELEKLMRTIGAAGAPAGGQAEGGDLPAQDVVTPQGREATPVQGGDPSEGAATRQAEGGGPPRDSGQPTATEPPAAGTATGSTGPVGGASGTLEDSPLAALPPGELLGAEVIDDEGNSVAEIVDMVKERDSETVLAVLSVGGLLGIGDKEVAMPLDRFRLGADRQIVLTGVTEQELQDMPKWQGGDRPYESLAR